MPATLEPTLGLNLLTPKTLERLGDDLPPRLRAPLRWCVTAFAEASRPILGAKNFEEVKHALSANLGRFAAVRMRFLEFLFELVGGEDRRLLDMLREMSSEIADEFVDEAEAVVGRTGSLYLAQALSLAEAGLTRIEQSVRTPQGFNWTLGTDEELKLRTWALRSDALLIICAIGVSEPENVGDDRLLAELCRGAYEATSQYLTLLERVISSGAPPAACLEALVAEFGADEPQWVHALEANEWSH